jgi:hypothetical protein
MRKDGFVSLLSKNKEGYMISKHIFLKSKRMEINYETSAGGYIRIELVDSFNKIIVQKGNNILIGNKVNGNYTFNVSENYIDKPIRLKIYLKEADIYSFKFIK